MLIFNIFIMQLTISQDYTDITFTHSVLKQSEISTLSLRYKKNCGTLQAVDITSKIGTIIDATSSITLNISDIISGKTIFDDGVYYFELIVGGPDVPPDNVPGTYFLKGCIYIGTTSRCKALCLYETSENELLLYLIKALDLVNDCDECDCSTQCELYDYLTTLLTTKITDNVYKSCGCD